jgi:hypothetical protein
MGDWISVLAIQPIVMGGEHWFILGIFWAGEKSQLLWLISLIITELSNKG